MGAILMTLPLPELPKINEKKTIENVRNYFENDFPKYVDRCSFSASFIKSPIFDVTGVKGSNKGNSEENKVYNHLRDGDTYDYLVEKTAFTIGLLAEPYKSILAEVYFSGSTNIQVQDKIHIGSTRYSQLKQKAFLKFAIKFGGLVVYEDNDDKFKKVNTL